MPPISAVRRALTPELRAELWRQCANLPASAARDARLAQLADPNVGVVVTGQQVGLFLGPALTFYKAATAITLARTLSAGGMPTLPLFWLQSEDHDIDEVQSVNVLDTDDQLRRVPLDKNHAHRVSMSERVLGDHVTEALSSLASALDGAPFRDESLALLARHYRPSVSWVAAFSATLAEVFADEGLLPFTPRTRAVAELLRPMYRRAVESALAVEQATQAGALAVQSEGLRPGIAPRQNCSLFFFHPQGAGGPRYRLVRDGERWAVPTSGATRSTSELLDSLEQEPLEFSTSSLLRVVAQQTLFPTVTQVAGPAEAHYLRQVPPLLAAFDVPGLLVAPRVRIVVVDARSRRRLDKLGLRAAEFDGPETVLHRLADRDAGVRGEEVSKALETMAAEQLARFQRGLLAIDPELQHALSRTRRHVAKGAAGLARRIDRARMLRDAERTEQVARVGRWLTPGNNPQERTIGASCFIARFGLESFKTSVFRAVEQHVEEIDTGHSPRLQEIFP